MVLRSRRRFLHVTVGACTASLAGCTVGSDSGSGCRTGRTRHESTVALDAGASWPTYQYDAANTGYNPDASGPSGRGDIAWRYSACTEAESGVAVHGGRVYAGGTLVDGRSGQRVAGDWHGHMRTPTVAGGTLYVSTFDLEARDAATGERLWTFRTDGEAGSIPASTVSGDTVYVPGNLDDSTLYAVDAATGTERWRAEMGGDISTPPAVVDGTAYVVDDTETVSALDATTGARRWTRTFDASVHRSAPVVADDTLFHGSLDGTVLALHADDGTTRWRRRVDRTGFKITSPVAVARGTVFAAGREGTLLALDAATGRPDWSVTTDAFELGAPAVADGVVYVGATGDPGTLFAVDAASGTERWRVETRAVGFGDYTRSGIVLGPAVAGDLVYVATAPGDIYAIAAQG